MAVWIVVSSGLTLMILSPAIFMILFLALMLVGCVTYKIHHKNLGTRGLVKNLASDLGQLVANIVEDSRFSFSQAAAWYQQREARIEQEMAQERERQAQRRERLQELQRKRKERPTSEYLTPGEYEVYRELRNRNESKAEQQSQREFL
jgi:membrane protein involved in colicin uptake